MLHWETLTLAVLDILALLLIGALVANSAKRRANRLLAVALLCSVVESHLVFYMLEAYEKQLPLLSNLLRLPYTLRMLALPLFYLYIRSYTNPARKLSARDMIHLVPFTISLGWYVVVLKLKIGPLLEVSDTFYWERYVRLILLTVLETVYGFLSLRGLWRIHAHDFVSYRGETQSTWFFILSMALFAFWCVDISDLVSGPFILVGKILPVVTTAALFTLAYFSIRPSPVFDEAELQEREKEKEPSALADEQVARYAKDLRAALVANSLYLNPELRLSDLATALRIKPYRVSEVLRRGLNTTFYDLINGYRVEHAQRMLRDPGFDHWNLLGVAEECGFKSKSVFNDVFKERSGKTPSEFRKDRPPAS